MKIIGKKSLSSVIHILLSIFFLLVSIESAVFLIGVFFDIPILRKPLNGIVFSGIFFRVDEKVILPMSHKLMIAGMRTFVLSLLFFWKAIFKNISNNLIFVPKNFIYFRRVGYIIICLSILRGFFSYASWKLLSQYIEFSNFEMKSLPNFIRPELFFLGISLIIISETFKRAMELKEENDLTI